MNTRQYPDPGRLAEAAAELVLGEVRAGRGRLLLAGGTTPRLTYELLAGRMVAADHAGLEVFFGDERMVPPDHPDSNYGMVARAWLIPGAVPPGRVHRIRGELHARAAAAAAAADLLAAGGAEPTIDVALLGLGADGHTASLFPGDAALAERARWFAPARGGQRVTATLPLLAAARLVVFLVSGADKAEAVRSAHLDPPGTVPASLVGQGGRAPLWLLDRQAAALLPAADASRDT